MSSDNVRDSFRYLLSVLDRLMDECLQTESFASLLVSAIRPFLLNVGIHFAIDKVTV
jgi:hypothetical protein